MSPSNTEGDKLSSGPAGQSSGPKDALNEPLLARSEAKYKETLLELKSAGSVLRSDLNQPAVTTKPEWFDATLFESAKAVYSEHFMAINFAHLSGLLLLVRVDSVFRTLSSTGKSDSVSKLFNRYYQTIIHVKKWYEGDIFDENSEAHRSLLIVRGMHNQVSRSLNNSKKGSKSNLNESASSQFNANEGESVDFNDNETIRNKINQREDEGRPQKGVHISQYDIMITQFAFVGFIVMHAKSVGLIEKFDEFELRSLLHFWRVIGYYLGASDKFNLCSRSLDDIQGLCESITDCEYRQSIAANPISSSPGIMSVNILRSVKFIPMLTIYGMLKYLYDLLRIDTAELEAKSSRYSRLSHTLIKLVMTNLLAYKPLRIFNNSLTRLSVYIVGKFQDHFVSHLENKYGSDLKAM